MVSIGVGPDPSAHVLAATVAHAISNPLAAIAVNVQLVLEVLGALKDGSPIAAAERAELLEALRESRAAAEKMHEIVRDLRAFARP